MGRALKKAFNLAANPQKYTKATFYGAAKYDGYYAIVTSELDMSYA